MVVLYSKLGVCMDVGVYIHQLHASTNSHNVVSSPTLPGKTTKGTLRCLEVGSSHRQSGTPGAACPTIVARLTLRPLVAASDEVMPPWKESVL